VQLKDNAIVITQFDHRRLEGLMAVMRDRSRHDDTHLADLEEELERAQVVDPHEVPADVVTMNSKVLLTDLDTGERRDVTLVFPGASNACESRISVLAPMGLALLGGREGEQLRWPTPARVRSLRIERVLYQPEAAGNFLL
jgi:regulator of nucleoside diphosphate kinase